MATTLNALAIRARLGTKTWWIPQPFGPDGWLFDTRPGWEPRARIIVTYAGTPEDVNDLWVHASISRSDGVPNYEDLTHLHKAVWGDKGWAYQVFAPKDEHINIHPNALHLWGRLQGEPELPNFGVNGRI